jgi:3-oxoacyl-[acyl-carrier protein] reductase
MTKYNEISVGDSAEIEHVVTASDIEKFVELTGDDNRLHIDPDYAAHTSLKKPVAHGMLGASFISTVIGTKLPGDGALWFAQSLEFLQPVRVGDKLTVRAKVLRKIDRMQAIELQTDIFNQHRQKVTTGVAKVKVIERVMDIAPEPIIKKHVALVIGGSGGIGSAICKTLAKDGFEVALHYFSNSGGATRIVDEIKAEGGNALAVEADINSEAAIAAMVDRVVRRFGNITVLVNCATARIAATNFNDLLWGDFEKHLNISIRGTFNLVRAVLPAMEKERYGKIIVISSQVSDTPVDKLLPYITAKGALDSFCRALALELAPKGIRVNSVSPSMTDTDLIADIPERERLLTAAKTPLQRLARPDDVAGAVAFLASDRSDFLTGETIRVNGGQVMR